MVPFSLPLVPLCGVYVLFLASIYWGTPLDTINLLLKHLITQILSRINYLLLVKSSKMHFSEKVSLSNHITITIIIIIIRRRRRRKIKELHTYTQNYVNCRGRPNGNQLGLVVPVECNNTRQNVEMMTT